MNTKPYKLFIVLLLALTSFKKNYGQQNNANKDDTTKSRIRSLINSKRYVFMAQTALPIGRTPINLTSSYNLNVSGDTVISDLPYFGRAYVAPMDPADAGFQFTSTDFTYDIKERKKGGWDISISPKDGKDVRQMFLTVTESGYGTLQVTSNNRQAIGYNGYVIDRNKNNKTIGNK